MFETAVVAVQTGVVVAPVDVINGTDDCCCMGDNCVMVVDCRLGGVVEDDNVCGGGCTAANDKCGEN